MAEKATGDDPFGLDGKVAIVTGGGAVEDGIGNGRAAAILLARAGARVLVVDVELERAERTLAMIASEGGTAAAFVADVTDEGQARAMVAAALERFGRLDCLDNNVGIGGRKAEIEDTLTMAPPPAVSFIAGIAWREARNMLSTLTCMTRRQFSGAMSTACSWPRAMPFRQ